MGQYLIEPINRSVNLKLLISGDKIK